MRDEEPPSVTMGGAVRRLVSPGHRRRVVPQQDGGHPDAGTLVVDGSVRHRLTAFDPAADGTLGDRRAGAELGMPTRDGICTDAEGAIWYAEVPTARCVRVAEGGEVLEVVEANRAAARVHARRGRTVARC